MCGTPGPADDACVTNTSVVGPVETLLQSHIRICQHCSLPYDWRRSPSACLKMTYCGSLCERGDLGFTIEGLLAERQVVRRDWRQLLAA